MASVVNRQSVFSADPTVVVSPSLSGFRTQGRRHTRSTSTSTTPTPTTASTSFSAPFSTNRSRRRPRRRPAGSRWLTDGSDNPRNWNGNRNVAEKSTPVEKEKKSCRPNAHFRPGVGWNVPGRKRAPRKLKPKPTTENIRSFLTAARNGVLHLVEWYVQNEAYGVHVEGDECYTPLHMACIGGREEVVLMLMNNGANPMAKSVRRSSWAKRTIAH